MTGVKERPYTVPPVNETLTRVVLLMRILGWAWMMTLAITTLGQSANADEPPDSAVIVAAMVMGTAGTILMLVAARRGFLSSSWYVALDGLIAIGLLSAAWIAGAPDFFAGGYPMSWLFLVAYATDFKSSLVAAVALTGVFAGLHLAMDLPLVRVVGSLQFLIVSLIVSWAFDSLRAREALRLEAEADAESARRALSAEHDNATRLEERSTMARRLHDSVLQTLKLIMANAGNPDEVRYLARIQERELRRTINEYRSPHPNSLRARLLDCRADIEDAYRVEIEQVIRGDIETSERMETLVHATHEALANSARHADTGEIDLFADVGADGVRVNVRDRGGGFDATATFGGGITHSIIEPIEAIGGSVRIKSGSASGTDVEIWVPLP